MIVSAPASRAAITLASPRCPGPRISTVSPGPVRGISTAQRKPAPSGLNITARLAGMSFRPCARSSTGRGTCSPRRRPRARAPARAGRSRARTCRRARGTGGSARRGRRGQWPHGISVSTATRSPTSTPQRRAARSPIFSITPSGSWPGTTGIGAGMTPRYCSSSLPQMPHASTRRSALSSSMSGIGRSRSSSVRGAVWTTAREVRMGGGCHGLRFAVEGRLRLPSESG